MAKHTIGAHQILRDLQLSRRLPQRYKPAYQPINHSRYGDMGHTRRVLPWRPCQPGGPASAPVCGRQLGQQRLDARDVSGHGVQRRRQLRGAPVLAHVCFPVPRLSTSRHSQREQVLVRCTAASSTP